MQERDEEKRTSDSRSRRLVSLVGSCLRETRFGRHPPPPPVASVRDRREKGERRRASFRAGLGGIAEDDAAAAAAAFAAAATRQVRGRGLNRQGDANRAAIYHKMIKQCF